MIWISFCVCLAVIGYAGIKLSKYGDAIADKTGLGRTWIGIILLASVTSLPELVTGISSVTVAKAPEIAVGDVLGSCLFNLLIIVVLDFLHRGESVYTRAKQGHILSAGFGVVLIGLAAFNILIASSGVVFTVGHVGVHSMVMMTFYLVAMSTLFRYEKQRVGEFVEAKKDQYKAYSLRQVVERYLIAAVAVVAAGTWLPFVAKQIARETGWYESFVGTLLVAFVTSLPELVVTVAAFRLGALDMAISNLFGSNLFNIMILTIDDALYLRGPLLVDVSVTHAASAVSAIMMTGIAIVALLYRPKKRVFKTVGWASIFLLTAYLFNSYVLYLYGA